MDEPGSEFQRFHLQKQDLDWLPPNLQMVRKVVSRTIWTGAIGAGVASIALPHLHLAGLVGGFTKAMFVGGVFAGDRAARSLLRRRLIKLTHGQLDLSRLRQEPDGELVHVRGRVRAGRHLPGVFDPSVRAVYRRLRLFLGDELPVLRWIHEAAVDFSLVDERGEAVTVQVQGARLVVADPKLVRLGDCDPEVERILALLPMAANAHAWLARRDARVQRGKPLLRSPARGHWRGDFRLAVGEALLRDGDEIEVVGYKSRVVDPTLAARLERDIPLRATLRSGRELPVILSMAIDRSARSGNSAEVS
jgi:hypothetical protein